MILQSLLPDSIFGTIATVRGEESLEKAHGFIEYNRPFISRFPRVAVALNKFDDCSPAIMAKYKQMWMDAFPEAGCWSVDHNRGHMFGTIDLDESLVRYAKSYFKPFPWLFKSTEDMLLDNKIIENEVKRADFYYLPSFSYETISQNGGMIGIKNMLKKHIYPIVPQTNFFVLNLKKVQSLYGPDVNEKAKKYHYAVRAQPNLKPWEFKCDDGIKFDMETLLYESTKSLSKFSLLSDESVGKLCNFVNGNLVGDPSHKNIFFNELGLCHYHFHEDNVIAL